MLIRTIKITTEAHPRRARGVSCMTRPDPKMRPWSASTKRRSTPCSYSCVAQELFLPPTYTEKVSGRHFRGCLGCFRNRFLPILAAGPDTDIRPAPPPDLAPACRLLDLTGFSTCLPSSVVRTGGQYVLVFESGSQSLSSHVWFLPETVDTNIHALGGDHSEA
jgi:hypothetical protein